MEDVSHPEVHDARAVSGCALSCYNTPVWIDFTNGKQLEELILSMYHVLFNVPCMDIS